MPFRSSNLGFTFVLVLALGFGVVGCDSAGPEVEPTTADTQTSTEEESFFKATNTLAGRMQTMGKSVSMTPFGASSPTAVTASKSTSSVSLTSIAQIDPPGDTTRASHLAYNSGTVYAGYKALGDPFKGGIDILDASDPTNILDVNSLGSDKLDVQEVAFDADENALYVAGAADPSSTSLSLKGTPSLLTKVTNFNNPTTSTVGLTGRVGKSVVNAPDGDQQHDLYVVTDEETLYRFDSNLGNELTQEVSGVEFRSVAATPAGVYTVDRNAKVYSGGVGSANPLTETQSIGSGVGTLAIGRLHARDEAVLNDDRLFVALGTEGIAVLDASGGDVLFRDDNPYYTSVTLHQEDPDVENAPTDLVYAARPNGIIDVFRIGPDGVDTGDPSTGLDEVGTFDLSALDGVEFGTSPQVNQVIGAGCNVYVANSNEGVVALEIGGIAGCGDDDGSDGDDGDDGDNGDDDDGDDSNDAPEAPQDAKAISFAAYCTTEENFDSDDVSIVDTQENEEGEVVSISWASDTELSSVVLKAGTSLFVHDGGSSGGAASGNGEEIEKEQGSFTGPRTPDSPCSSEDDEDLVVKDESVN